MSMRKRSGLSRVPPIRRLTQIAGDIGAERAALHGKRAA
jgi:hypothetical protein